MGRPRRVRVKAERRKARGPEAPRPRRKHEESRGREETGPAEREPQSPRASKRASAADGTGRGRERREAIPPRSAFCSLAVQPPSKPGRPPGASPRARRASERPAMAPRRGIVAPRRHRRCRVSLPCAWCTIPRSRSLALARAMLPLATALGAARRRDDRRDRWKGRCRPRRCCRTRRPRQDLAQRPSDRQHLWPAPVRQEAPSPVRDGLVHPLPRTVAVDGCGIAGGRNVLTPFSAGAGWPVDLVCKYDVPGIDSGRLMRTRRIRWTMYPR